jgi:hypothetical protein
MMPYADAARVVEPSALDDRAGFAERGENFLACSKSEAVVAVLKAREPARIMIALCDRTANR